MTPEQKWRLLWCISFKIMCQPPRDKWEDKDWMQDKEYCESLLPPGACVQPKDVDWRTLWPKIKTTRLALTAVEMAKLYSSDNPDEWIEKKICTIP